jgi:hypothetical protein
MARASAARGRRAFDPAAERPAHDPPRPGVEHDREIDEACGDGDIGDVGRPELVGAVPLEALCNEGKIGPS